MKHLIQGMILVVLCVGVLPTATGTSEMPEQANAARALDELHAAAAKADGARYFDLFTDDAVFIGTDATERWPIAEFKAYAMKRFETGTGWTYTLKPGTRHINIEKSGDIAWFDELLVNAKYGTCRGTGVLRKVGDEWKIAQYHLTIPVPNDLALDVVRMIKENEVDVTRDTPD